MAELKTMVCPLMDTCSQKKMWRKPVWAPGKEPHDDDPGTELGGTLVPQGHCVKHARCSHCSVSTATCPQCITVAKYKKGETQ